MKNKLMKIADLILKAKYAVAFTGAGISVESGIPSFRGKEGIWNKYDPSILEIDSFTRKPEKSWPLIRKLFYGPFNAAEPNPAHVFLAQLEKAGKLEAIITQNIDNLHHRAGSRNIIEYHGNSRQLICMSCGARYDAAEKIRESEVPRCGCGGLCKPDFTFFGEAIHASAVERALEASERCDLMILVGTTGEVYPAALIPRAAKKRGAVIVEINPDFSAYTLEITDHFLPLGAVKAAQELSPLLDLRAE